ncbi:MAG: hypothetical protein EBZ48_10065 [Proteobacteria bacterium]|nr:hypothetical protein [Pseudomonadota bacterium]
MVKTAEALLQQELGAARAGTHQRQKSEEKRLSLLKIQKLKKAEQTHQNRVAAVDARFEEQKREVCTHRPIAKTSAPSEQMRHGCEPQAVGWEDLPDDEAVGEALARGSRFAVAWRNNFSHEIGDAQKVSMSTFLSGAPWAGKFFHPAGASLSTGGRPGIRDKEQLTVQSAIDQYCDTFLQWLNQIATNLGSGFRQELFSADLLSPSDRFEYSLSRIVQGKARPRRPESADTVESIKVQMDCLPAQSLPHRGMAGLADCLWALVV